MENLIDKIKESKIGTNVPLNKALFIAANIKLKNSNIPAIPDKFGELLFIFNGLSNEGSLIFGAEINSTLFVDLVKYNRAFFQGNPSNILILGYDEVFFLIYDNINKNYKIVDKDTLEPEVERENFEDLIPYLLHI